MSRLYSVLGLQPDASDADIKRAYRQQAKRYHPDVAGDNPDSAKKFERISNAHEILGDKEKRAAYDRGEIGDDGQPKGFTGGFRDNTHFKQQSHQFSEFGGFGGIFDDFLNASSSSGFSAHTKGEDLTYKVTVDFESACKGASRRIQVHNKPLDIKIPAGIKSGQTLRLKGKGKQNGDVLVKIQVADHPYYTRKNNTIYSDVPLSLTEAVNGGKINVKTLHGSVTVTVPPNTHSNTTLRLKGKGIHRKGFTPGDHYITLHIALPPTPDGDLQNFVRSWKNIYNPRL